MALTSASVTRERDARPPGRLPAGSMSVRRDHLPPRMHAFAQADMRYEVSRSKPHFRNPGAEGNRLTPVRTLRPSESRRASVPPLWRIEPHQSSIKFRSDRSPNVLCPTRSPTGMVTVANPVTYSLIAVLCAGPAKLYFQGYRQSRNSTTANS